MFWNRNRPSVIASAYIMVNEALKNVSSDFDSIFVESASQKPEYVFTRIEVKKVNTFTLGIMFGSPNCTQTDDMRLCNELGHMAGEVKKRHSNSR